MKSSDQREFIHSLATPLGTAILLADTLKENLAGQGHVANEVLTQLDSLIDTLEILRKALRLRQEAEQSPA